MSEKNIDYTSTEPDYEYVYDKSSSKYYDYKTTNPDYIEYIRRYRKIDKFCIWLFAISVIQLIFHLIFVTYIPMSFGWFCYCIILPFILFGISLSIGLPNCSKYCKWISDVWEKSSEFNDIFEDLCEKEAQRQEKQKREKARKLVEIYSALDNKKLTKENKIEIIKDYMEDKW